MRLNCKGLILEPFISCRVIELLDEVVMTPRPGPVALPPRQVVGHAGVATCVDIDAMT